MIVALARAAPYSPPGIGCFRYRAPGSPGAIFRRRSRQAIEDHKPGKFRRAALRSGAARVSCHSICSPSVILVTRRGGRSGVVAPYPRRSHCTQSSPRTFLQGWGAPVRQQCAAPDAAGASCSSTRDRGSGGWPGGGTCSAMTGAQPAPVLSAANLPGCWRRAGSDAKQRPCGL